MFDGGIGSNNIAPRISAICSSSIDCRKSSFDSIFSLTQNTVSGSMPPWKLSLVILIFCICESKRKSLCETSPRIRVAILRTNCENSVTTPACRISCRERCFPLELIRLNTIVSLSITLFSNFYYITFFTFSGLFGLPVKLNCSQTVLVSISSMANLPSSPWLYPKHTKSA